MSTLDNVGAPPRVAMAGKLRLFSLYLDFPASVQARGMVCAITKQAGQDWLTTAEMWKLDALKSSPNIRRLMTTDAASAEVIIISASALAYPEPALIEWLYALTAEQHCQPGLLLGLLGDATTPAKEPDWVVKPLTHCARETGREVAWHGLDQNGMGEVTGLTEKLGHLLTRKRMAEPGGMVSRAAKPEHRAGGQPAGRVKASSNCPAAR